jgi:hypothetical protein
VALAVAIFLVTLSTHKLSILETCAEVMYGVLVPDGIATCESKQAAGAIFHRMISHTTISFSNMIGPVEQVEFCGHPVVFIAPSGYGPPEVSHHESDYARHYINAKKHVTFSNFRETFTSNH